MDPAAAPAELPNSRRRVRLPRLTYANVVATIALLMATGGTSLAAHHHHYAFTTLDIKNRTLRGVDVHKNSLTGTEIAENRLGPVPRAITADVAAYARKADSAVSANSAASATRARSADIADLAGTAQSIGGLSAAQLAATDAASVSIAATRQPLVTSRAVGIQLDARPPDGQYYVTSTRQSGVVVIDSSHRSVTTTVDVDPGSDDGSGSGKTAARKQIVLNPGDAPVPLNLDDFPITVWVADASDTRTLVIDCSKQGSLEHCVTTRVGGAS